MLLALEVMLLAAEVMLLHAEVMLLYALKECMEIKKHLRLSQVLDF